MENPWSPINIGTNYQAAHSPKHKWKYQLPEKSAKSNRIPTNSSFQKEVFSRWNNLGMDLKKYVECYIKRGAT